MGDQGLNLLIMVMKWAVVDARGAGCEGRELDRSLHTFFQILWHSNALYNL